MPRGNGGIIGPVNTSFSGVWSLTEAQLRRSANTWPNFYAALLSESATGSDVFSGADAADPYFEYTTLLLPGNGTNGAQNNTFLDGSTNNFTITRNGNTTQGTFSPFSQTGWSNYFDGSGDFINTPATGQFAPAGDFTIRFYFYLTSLAATTHLIGNYTANATTDWLIAVTTGGVLEVFTNGQTLRLSQSGITQNRWYYVTVTRTGTTITGQLDGTNFNTTATYTQSGTFGTATKSIYLGMLNGSVNPLKGYLSNVSLVDGSAIQTVPTAPLTAVTGTKLLTCQSNRFVDNSSSPNTLTIGGNTSVVAFSPFNPTASWSAATNGGSGYFDGSGDYLNTASDAAFTLGSSGDFTVEMFFYAPAAQATNAILISTMNNGSSDFVNRWGIQFATSTTLGWYNDAGSNGILSGTVVLSQWNHIAVCRSGSTIRMWLNGVSQGTQTTNQAYTTQGSVKVGFLTGLPAFSGYISNVRVVKGTAVYDASSSANITVPTAPLTAITNTSLLLNFTNAGIYDATSKNDLETVGNAQISTTQSKWGGSSMSFDGTGDSLITPASIVNSIGTGDFTIEFWCYPSNTAAAYRAIVASENYNSTAGGWSIYQNGTGIEIYLTSGAIVTAASQLVASTWQHIALVRSGSASNNCKLYVNGTNVASATNTADWTGQRIFIGDNNYPGTDYFFNGYIQDLRITKGYARYTANFTAPTAAFPTL